MCVFRPEDRARWACLKYINAQNSALWIILINPDSQHERHSGALLQWCTSPWCVVSTVSAFSLPIPAQCPCSAPTPEERTPETVGDWTQTQPATFLWMFGCVHAIPVALYIGKKITGVEKKQGVFIEDRLSEILSKYFHQLLGLRSCHCRTRSVLTPGGCG